MPMSCGELDKLVRILFLWFTVLFVSGFLVLYYAIRKVACAQGLCDSSFLHQTPPIYSADMLVMVFSVSVLFFALLWYVSSRERGE